MQWQYSDKNKRRKYCIVSEGTAEKEASPPLGTKPLEESLAAGAPGRRQGERQPMEDSAGPPADPSAMAGASLSPVETLVDVGISLGTPSGGS